MTDPELRQLVYLAQHGIRLLEFDEFDRLTINACAIICAEFASGGRWDFKAGTLILPNR